MQNVTAILDARVSTDSSKKLPIAWSARYIESLREMAANLTPLRSPLDDQFASVILLCVEENFEDAEFRLLDLMRSNIGVIKADNETFISCLFALFVAQHFLLVAAMLQDRYGFREAFSVAVENNGPGSHRVRWDVSADGTHRFVFDSETYKRDQTRTDLLAFQWEFPIYANFSFSPNVQTGTLIINQGDIGQTPGLAWCDNRPDYFLVPDCVFVPTKGYEYAREVAKKNLLPWENRKNVALWRGATTGVPRSPGDWRTLERVKLCELAQLYEHRGFIDVGLSSVAQFDDPSIVGEIRNSGLLRGFVPWENWGQFKYLIDIDGNSNPWSNLFQRLLTGSTVLKVESSRALNQWFYHELVPWENYVPIAPDLSDLIEKVEWLIRNDGYAREVGEAGRLLAERLTYTREVERSIETITAAFKYFRGERHGCGPFGRNSTKRRLVLES
jgi:hypothetical protein